MLANQYVSTGRKSFTTVTGKSSQVSLIKLRKPVKITVTTLVLFYTAFFAIVPLISFALESFLEVSGNYETFTLYYWITKEETNVYISGSVGILHNKTIWKAFGNSLLISLVVALIAGTCGILIGYAVAKNKGKKLSNFVSNISFLPYLIPAMSFSTIYLAVSSTNMFNFLYRSIPLLIKKQKKDFSYLRGQVIEDPDIVNRYNQENIPELKIYNYNNKQHKSLDENKHYNHFNSCPGSTLSHFRVQDYHLKRSLLLKNNVIINEIKNVYGKESFPKLNTISSLNIIYPI
jgi:hypothetical protein